MITDSLTKAADDYAEEAEAHRQITVIAKSIGMRSAKEKNVELKVVDQQLDSKLLELNS